MMHRAAAGADIEPVGSGNRCAHIDLGVAYRDAKVLTLRESGGDSRRQRAAGAVRIVGRETRRGISYATASINQKINAFRAVAMAALDQHRTDAQREQCFCL